MKKDRENELSKAFKSLYLEFIKLLNDSNNYNNILRMRDGRATVEFYLTIRKMGDLNDVLKVLTNLPSYNKLIELTAILQGVPKNDVDKQKLALFSHVFSDVANLITPPITNYKMPMWADVSNFNFSEKNYPTQF